MIREGTLDPEHRPLVKALLASLPAFTESERTVALELVDAHLSRPEVDEYRFILSFSGAEGTAGEAALDERLTGYLCYGRTPMTRTTYDLYWLVTSPDCADAGVARGLVASMEGEIAREGGGTIRVETGIREGHGATVHFYDTTGFSRTATIPDFYAPGDDLIIFTRRVSNLAAASLPVLDEAALYDAAFGYRDYAAERDFLLACARRFGGRDVRQVLAWACGPARHVWAFADIGVSGIGVDASAAMIAYAQRIGRSQAPASPRASSPPLRGPEVRFMRAELEERPDVGAPVDLSFVPLSSIHQVADPDALLTHLRCAAAVLQPGGLHVIEATHPADLTASGVHHTEWTEVRGDQMVDVRFRMHIDRLEGHRVPVTLEVVCSASNKKGAAPAWMQSAPRLRQEDRWYVPDLEGWRRVIARVPELTLAAVLGDFNVDVPFEHAAAWRLILVLRRV